MKIRHLAAETLAIWPLCDAKRPSLCNHGAETQASLAWLPVFMLMLSLWFCGAYKKPHKKAPSEKQAGEDKGKAHRLRRWAGWLPRPPSQGRVLQWWPGALERTSPHWTYTCGLCSAGCAQRWPASLFYSWIPLTYWGCGEKWMRLCVGELVIYYLLPGTTCHSHPGPG